MPEVNQALQEWYRDEDHCILHVRQDMIKKRWSLGIPIARSSEKFIVIMIEKFKILDRDYRQIQMIESLNN